MFLKNSPNSICGKLVSLQYNTKNSQCWPLTIERLINKGMEYLDLNSDMPLEGSETLLIYLTVFNSSFLMEQLEIVKILVLQPHEIITRIKWDKLYFVTKKHFKNIILNYSHILLNNLLASLTLQNKWGIILCIPYFSNYLV